VFELLQNLLGELGNAPPPPRRVLEGVKPFKTAHMRGFDF
jgi:hypothetical protein